MLLYILLISCISIYSYIKPQPDGGACRIDGGCISIYSYIKPQRVQLLSDSVAAVYLSIPTSNHNSVHDDFSAVSLYIYLFLHQTTTGLRRFLLLNELYIYLFLHQTTTGHRFHSFDSALYIYLFLHQTTTG